MAILEVEIDPSGRAKCLKCHQYIKRGSKRLNNAWTDSYMHKSVKYCRECAIELLEMLLEDLKRV